jgi:hypothetical protein
MADYYINLFSIVHSLLESSEISIQYMMSHLCSDFTLCMTQFIWSFSLLSTTHDSNKSRNSLAINMSNYLNSILQETF